MRRLGLIIATVGFFIAMYVVGWVFGNHGHTYFMEAAKQVGTEWVCPPSEGGEQGPRWDEGKEAVCHIPVSHCPSLWFPIATVVPCPYKDPLGDSPR
jgi:hypothetical protein